MTFVSLTRLRLRSVGYLPFFAVYAFRSTRQLRVAPGFLGGSLLPDRRQTFWTLTRWNSEADMRAYMLSGAHKKAMPHLMNWCDEASVVHWEQESDALPSWTEAERRMRQEGRPSKVRHPSSTHAGMQFMAPKTSLGAQISPNLRP